VVAEQQAHHRRLQDEDQLPQADPAGCRFPGEED
jgi:hypothetical protein